LWKGVFVVAPIILGAVAAWPILKQQTGYEWLTGVCALLAGIAPAAYKALDFDVSLDTVAKHAHESKILQDRFRRAWRVTALGSFEDFKKEFDDLMTRVDAARSTSLTAPEHFFKKAQEKIAAGHYSFSVDEKRTERKNCRTATVPDIRSGNSPTGPSARFKFRILRNKNPNLTIPTTAGETVSSFVRYNKAWPNVRISVPVNARSLEVPSSGTFIPTSLKASLSRSLTL
jgi:hypothetical protein